MIIKKNTHIDSRCIHVWYLLMHCHVPVNGCRVRNKTLSYRNLNNLTCKLWGLYLSEVCEHMVTDLFEINSLKLAQKSCTSPSTTLNIKLPQYPPNRYVCWHIPNETTQPQICTCLWSSRHLASKWHKPQVFQMRISRAEHRLMGLTESTHWCLEGILTHERQTRVLPHCCPVI